MKIVYKKFDSITELVWYIDIPIYHREHLVIIFAMICAHHAKLFICFMRFYSNIMATAISVPRSYIHYCSIRFLSTVIIYLIEEYNTAHKRYTPLNFAVAILLFVLDIGDKFMQDCLKDCLNYLIWGPFHLHVLTLTPALISNYIHYEFGMKSLFHSKTSTVQTLKLGDG